MVSHDQRTGKTSRETEQARRAKRAKRRASPQSRRWERVVRCGKLRFRRKRRGLGATCQPRCWSAGTPRRRLGIGVRCVTAALGRRDVWDITETVCQTSEALKWGQPPGANVCGCHRESLEKRAVPRRRQLFQQTGRKDGKIVRRFERTNKFEMVGME